MVKSQSIVSSYGLPSTPHSARALAPGPRGGGGLTVPRDLPILSLRAATNTGICKRDPLTPAQQQPVEFIAKKENVT